MRAPSVDPAEQQGGGDEITDRERRFVAWNERHDLRQRQTSERHCGGKGQNRKQNDRKSPPKFARARETKHESAKLFFRTGNVPAIKQLACRQTAGCMNAHKATEDSSCGCFGSYPLIIRRS